MARRGKRLIRQTIPPDRAPTVGPGLAQDSGDFSQMPHQCRPLLVVLFATYMALPASARDRAPTDDPPMPNATTQPLDGPGMFSGKERLGKKWIDEQRINNCKVPIDKRGAKPRPNTSPQTPSA